MARLREQFQKEGIKKLGAELGIKNVMRVPKLRSITLSMCLSEALESPRVLETAAKDL